MDWNLIITRLKESQNQLQPEDIKILRISGIIQVIQASLIDGGGHAQNILGNASLKQSQETRIKDAISITLPSFEFEENDEGKERRE